MGVLKSQEAVQPRACRGTVAIDSITINQGGGPVLIALGPNQIIKTISTPFEANLGFLVDKTVQVVFQNLNNGNFIVPQGKVFVLFNNYLATFYLNGVQGGYANIPIAIPSGTIISGTGILNGYLR